MKITAKNYAQALLELSETVSAKKLAEKFWYDLQKNGDYGMLDQIINSLIYVYAEKRSLLAVKVISAKPMSDSKNKIISDALYNKYQRNALITNIIQPNIQFGYRISLEDKVFDNTFIDTMNKLKRHVLEKRNKYYN